MGRVVRDKRIAFGWTQKQLADEMRACGLRWHATTVTKVELGQRPFSLHEVVALSVLLCFRIDDVAGQLPPEDQMRDIPRSHCNRCRQLFDTRQQGTWVEVRGWVEVRSKGGANAVHDKRETGNVLCPRCAKERALGVIPGQALLFDQ